MQSAMEWFDEQDVFDDLAVFLDFDGTLAPIVDRPGEARPVDGVTEVVEAIATRLPVAVISGRGLDDVAQRLGADGIYYSGSHGMEIQSPDGERDETPQLQALLPVLDHHEEQLRRRFAEEPGVEIERKRFGVAVHFRRRPEARDTVQRVVEEAAGQSPKLKWSTGKMVRELQPDVDLHKGTALRAIRERIDEEHALRPIYIGDDRTDEDAFEAIADDGIGILVAQDQRPTAARLRLDDPVQVKAFLRRLAKRLDVSAETSEIRQE